jgi:hypothetical protein
VYAHLLALAPLATTRPGADAHRLELDGGVKKPRDAGKLQEALKLPSGGDTSYAGLVWHAVLLWVSYYSSHEGKSAIYLARVKVAK